MPYSDEQWTPIEDDLKPFLPSHAEVLRERKVQNTFARQNLGYLKSVSALMSYKNIALNGFALWSEYDSTLINSEVHSKIGKDRNAKINACDIIETCGSLKFFSKEATVFGSGRGGARHHPTRAGHMFRGEMFVWQYGMILLDAMFSIQEELLTKSPLSPDSILKSISN